MGAAGLAATESRIYQLGTIGHEYAGDLAGDKAAYSVAKRPFIQSALAGMSGGGDAA